MARLQIDLQGNISAFAAQIQVANSLLSDLNKNAKIDLGSSLGSIGTRGIARLGGIAAGLNKVYKVASQATKSIIDFDSGLIDISKTTGISGKELQGLSDDMINLSRRLQVIDTSKLLEYGTVAGQLGIHGSKDIQNFSESLAKLETATDVSGRAGAEQVARFLQLADGGVKNIKAFGDELVHLGNNFAATESQILSNALSIAQNTGAYNIARNEMLAYAAATSAVGIQSEVVGSAINRVLQQLSIAASGGKNATEVFNTLKVSQSELSDLLRNNASGAFKLLVERLNEGYKSGKDLNSILRDMGIRNIRDIRVVQTLATRGYDVLNDSMRKVGESASALNDEFDKQSEKISAQIGRIKTSWENLILSVDNGKGIWGRAMVGMADSIANLFDRITNAVTSRSWSEFFGRLGGLSSINPIISTYVDNVANAGRYSSSGSQGNRILPYSESKRIMSMTLHEMKESLKEEEEALRTYSDFYSKSRTKGILDQLNLTAAKTALLKQQIGFAEKINESSDSISENDKNQADNAKRKSDELLKAREIIDRQLASWGLIDANLRVIDSKYDDILKKAKMLNIEASEMAAILSSKDIERFRAIFGLKKDDIVRTGLPSELSGSLNVSNLLPNLNEATNRILKNIEPKITFGDELSRQTQRAITRGLVRGFDDIFNNINDLGSNFYDVFSNVFSKLSEATMSTFQNALINSLGEKFVDKFSKGFRFGNLSTDVSNAIVAGVGLGASLLGSNVFKTTSYGGQALSGGISGAVTGLSVGSAIGGPAGGIVGAIGGAILGGISGLFGAKSARKQERIQEAQLKEQELMRRELERQSALAWDARIIGQMSNLGLVSGFDRDMFGNIVGRISGKDIVLVYERELNSR